MEGLAVYSANQLGVDNYLSKQETYDKINKEIFVEPKDWGTLLTTKGETVEAYNSKDKYFFIYSEYGCIVDDLIEIYGKEKFIFFVKESLKADQFYVLFKETYKRDFAAYLTDFKNRVKAYNNSQNFNE